MVASRRGIGVERELGSGGMATVYLAHDVRHDRNVALKVLRPDLAAVMGGSIVDNLLCTMHSTHMATKTISLRVEAYERLRRARLRPDESFSDVVMRAQWVGNALTAGELREVYGAEGAHLSEDELDAIERAKASVLPFEDKWRED